MPSTICVPVPTELFIELHDFLRKEGAAVSDPVETVATAIRYWLDNAGWKPELVSKLDAESRGYVWKTLFLPHGTQVRMKYRGKQHYAAIEGDEMLFEGQPTSPAGFAKSVGCTGTNAWRYLWVKRPDDAQWLKADDCRKEDERASNDLLSELDAPSA